MIDRLYLYKRTIQENAMKFALLGTMTAFFAGALAIAAVAGSDTNTTTEVEEEPEFGILFVAEGVEATYYSCSGCHSERIIAQQGLTRGGWEEILEWMVDEQGMGELDDEDTKDILDYLSAHYNVDRLNFPKD